MKKILLLTVAALIGCTGFGAEKNDDSKKSQLYVRYIYKNMGSGQFLKNLRVIDKNCLLNGKNNFYQLNSAFAQIEDGLAQKDLMKVLNAFALIQGKSISAEQKKQFAALKGTEKESAVFAQITAGVNGFKDKSAKCSKEMKFVAVKSSGNIFYVVTYHNKETNIHTLKKLQKGFKLIAVQDVSAAEWEKLQPVTFDSIKKYLNKGNSSDDLEAELEDLD